jgi:hypothetical protein
MKKKYRRTIGNLQYDEKHDFFFGQINGTRVTMNRFTDKEGKVRWILNEEFELFEVQEKKQEDVPY